MSAVRRNAAWLVLSQGATWIVSVVLLVVAPRELGNNAFGRMTFAMAYVAFFELIALFGTGDYLTKTVARQPDDVGRYVANTLRLKGITSTALLTLAVGIAAIANFDREMMLLIGIFALGMVLNVLNNALMGGLQGIQRMGPPAFWGVVRMYVGAALGLAILYAGGGLPLYCLAFNVVAIIPIVANAWQLWPELRRTGRFDRSVWAEVLKGGFPFFVLAMLLAIYGSIDILMLEVFADSDTVGWYALAYRWVSMPAFFTAAVATAFFPALAREGVAVSPAFCRMADRAVQAVLLVAVPISVGIALVADDFIGLVYSDEFASSVPLMRLLAVHIPIVALDVVLGTVAISADRQRKWMIYSANAVGFNVVANLFAIPHARDRFDNAAIGAAITTVMTELILACGAYRLRPTGVFERPVQGLVMRIAIASLAMVPIVLLIDGAPMGVKVAVGAVTYVVASFLLRTISIDDLRDLTARVSHRHESDVEEIGAAQ